MGGTGMYGVQAERERRELEEKSSPGHLQEINAVLLVFTGIRKIPRERRELKEKSSPGRLQDINAVLLVFTRKMTRELARLRDLARFGVFGNFG